MIKIPCHYTSLEEVKSSLLINYYQDFIRPLDYDFCLLKDHEYILIGFSLRQGTPWVYVCESYGSNIETIPAILFDFSWEDIPMDWETKIVADVYEIEILPRSLAGIDHWYEKYIEEDEFVMNVIKSVSR